MTGIQTASATLYLQWLLLLLSPAAAVLPVEHVDVVLAGVGGVAVGGRDDPDPGDLHHAITVHHMTLHPAAHPLPARQLHHAGPDVPVVLLQVPAHHQQRARAWVMTRY